MANLFSIFNVKKDLKKKEKIKNVNNIETNLVYNDDLDDLQLEEVNNETGDLRNTLNGPVDNDE